MKKEKKIIGILMVISCLFALSIPLTKAYFTDSQQVENTITIIGKDGLTGEISESNWNNANGLKIMPNSTIKKNPQITNTSNSVLTELVAMQIQFVYSQDCPTVNLRGTPLNSSDMKIVSDIVEIDFQLTTKNENGKWTRFDGESNKLATQHFYYNGLLPTTKHMDYNEVRTVTPKGETTQPLFTTVHINQWANQAQIQQLEKIGGFEIKVDGHVLQHIAKVGSGLNNAKTAYETGMFKF